MAPIQRIDCHKCIHYYVTWQKAHPHGCKAMGFKSLQMPSVVVFKNSGSPCLSFELKKASTAKTSPSHSKG